FSGRPGAALLSSTSLLITSYVKAGLENVVGDYVFLNSGPLFHIGTQMGLLHAFQHGGTNVFIRRIEPHEVCRLIEAERCTGAYIVTSTQEQIVEINADRRYDLSSLRSTPGSPRWNSMVTVDTS